MQKKLFVTYLSLLALTAAGATVAIFSNGKVAAAMLLFIAILKFSTVGFQFMELRSAHPLWKNLLLMYSILLAAIIWFIVAA